MITFTVCVFLVVLLNGGDYYSGKYAVGTPGVVEGNWLAKKFGAGWAKIIATSFMLAALWICRHQSLIIWLGTAALTAWYGYAIVKNVRAGSWDRIKAVWSRYVKRQ
jgi:hypothetical protein